MHRNKQVLRWLATPLAHDITGVILTAAWQRHHGRVAVSAEDWRNGEKLHEAAVRTIEELRKLGLRVLVLGPVPDIPYPAPECIFRARSEADLRRCRYSANDVRLAQQDIVNALRLAAAQFDNARFIDLKPAFCDRAYCWPARGRSIYYTDTNHLSVSGARMLHSQFRDDLAWVFESEERQPPMAALPSDAGGNNSGLGRQSQILGARQPIEATRVDAPEGIPF